MAASCLASRAVAGRWDLSRAPLAAVQFLRSFPDTHLPATPVPVEPGESSQAHPPTPSPPTASLRGDLGGRLL